MQLVESLSSFVGLPFSVLVIPCEEGEHARIRGLPREVLERVARLEWHEADVLYVAHAGQADEEHLEAEFGSCDRRGQVRGREEGGKEGRRATESTWPLVHVQYDAADGARLDLVIGDGVGKVQTDGSAGAGMNAWG